MSYSRPPTYLAQPILAFPRRQAQAGGCSAQQVEAARVQELHPGPGRPLHALNLEAGGGGGQRQGGGGSGLGPGGLSSWVPEG